MRAECCILESAWLLRALHVHPVCTPWASAVAVTQPSLCCADAGGTAFIRVLTAELHKASKFYVDKATQLEVRSGQWEAPAHDCSAMFGSIKAASS